MKRCFAALDKLEAEESVLAFKRIAMGSGSMKDGKTAQNLMDSWLRLSEIADERPRRSYPTADDVRARGLKVFGPKPKA